jgi:hypothetical protein
MSLVTAETFRNTFNLRDSSVPLETYLSAASSEVKNWVGVQAYVDAEKLSDGNPATNPDDVSRAHRLTLAETYLAMYYGYPAFSIQIESGVIVKADRSEGEVVRSFENARERREGRKGYYDMAVELVEPYLASISEPDQDESVVPGSTWMTIINSW